MRIIVLFVGITTAIIINYIALTNFDKVTKRVDNIFETIMESIDE